MSDKERDEELPITDKDHHLGCALGHLCYLRYEVPLKDFIYLFMTGDGDLVSGSTYSAAETVRILAHFVASQPRELLEEAGVMSMSMHVDKGSLLKN